MEQVFNDSRPKINSDGRDSNIEEGKKELTDLLDELDEALTVLQSKLDRVMGLYADGDSNGSGDGRLAG